MSVSVSVGKHTHPDACVLSIKGSTALRFRTPTTIPTTIPTSGPKNRVIALSNHGHKYDNLNSLNGFISLFPLLWEGKLIGQTIWL